MKTAVSIPDDIFERAERLAAQARRSRNEVYAAALNEYFARRAQDEVTDAMNRACDEIGGNDDAFLAAAFVLGHFRSATKAMPERTGRTIEALFNNGAHAGPDTVEDLPGSRPNRGCNSVAIVPEDPVFTSAVAPGTGP